MNVRKGLGLGVGVSCAAAVLGVVGTLAALGAGAFSPAAEAQAGAQCKVESAGNVVLFERAVADRMNAGWQVKGGVVTNELGQWMVLMCNR